MLKERRCKQSCSPTEEKEGALNSQLSHSWILEEIEKYSLSKLTNISDHITFICGIQTIPVLSTEIHVPCLKITYTSPGHLE